MPVATWEPLGYELSLGVRLTRELNMGVNLNWCPFKLIRQLNMGVQLNFRQLSMGVQLNFHQLSMGVQLNSFSTYAS